MEAKLVDAIPDGDDWQFEPKWDGFRCLVFRDGDEVELQSKAQRPLGRYFPEVVETVRTIKLDRFVVDGELMIEIDGEASFEALQNRLHPAESRIKKLSALHPAHLTLFDALEIGKHVLIDRPLSERRAALESFHEKAKVVRLSPATRNSEKAEAWLAGSGGSLDGIVAKPLVGVYRPGERAMFKVKTLRSADCVVGGFRYGANDRLVASLLLGLYDEDGLLHHVGFTASIAAADREALTAKLEPFVEPPGFTGRSPGGPSRWSTGRSADWQPLRPVLVVEVRYDQVTGDRLRHGARFLRWRPDKAPEQCRMEQLQSGKIVAAS
jgi:ATP-dependent DNA ligase